MKLCYRGVSYEYNPPVVEVAQEKVGGKYRGLDWRFHNLKKPPVLQPSVNLTYRGVTYSNRPVFTPIKDKASTSVKEKGRWLMLKTERVTQNRTAAMLHRSAQKIGLV